MKDRLSELGWVTWMLVLATIIVAVGFIWFAVLRPATLSVERRAVETSKSYNDSSNIALSNYIVQYEASVATDGQKKAIINAMCEITLKMQKDLVIPRITKFLAQHGGCE